ncbi:MAG: hypothetical protein KUF74_00980 [Candidatus Thiodiazotropha sp. (ex Ctena orbiculata)]|nr:hypothetical protein [Candidatus Thiodiazotropha taylori]
MPKQPLIRLAAPILLLTQLPACTGIGGVSGEMPLRIESEPSGATVYVLDEALGGASRLWKSPRISSIPPPTMRAKPTCTEES